VESLAGSDLKIELPFDTSTNKAGDLIEISTQKGEILIFKPRTK
jgi:hypothetical protein